MMIKKKKRKKEEDILGPVWLHSKQYNLSKFKINVNACADDQSNSLRCYH